MTPRQVPYKPIPTEEAWAPPSLLQTYRSLAANKTNDDPGFNALWKRLGSRGPHLPRHGANGSRFLPGALVNVLHSAVSRATLALAEG